MKTHLSRYSKDWSSGRLFRHVADHFNLLTSIATVWSKKRPLVRVSAVNYGLMLFDLTILACLIRLVEALASHTVINSNAASP